MEVYLDNSATTRPCQAAIDGINRALTETYGNPSSLHRHGLAAERLLKEARHRVAQILSATDQEIVFTSGGTESNNLAICGALACLRTQRQPLVTTEIEHASVLNVFKHLEKAGHRVIYLPVNSRGILEPEAVSNILTEHPALISIMAVNNEIGSIQPLAEIGNLLRQQNPKPIFHCDGVQAFGKIPLLPASWGIDLLSFSGHKFHGPKGIGGLYVRQGIKLQPLLQGGSQENNLRPGTENIPGITGMGAAAAEIGTTIESNLQKFNQLKTVLIDKITATIPGTRINSPIAPDFAPNILSISFKGVRAEVLLHSLEQDGIFVSTRSACTSKKKHASHVLQALKLSPTEIEGTIRISFGHFNQLSELDYVLERIQFHIDNFRRITGWRE